MVLHHTSLTSVQKLEIINAFIESELCGCICSIGKYYPSSIKSCFFFSVFCVLMLAVAEGIMFSGCPSCVP